MTSRYGIFCSVAETGSFTKTARRFGYSQSAVSQNVKALEDELGVVLIDRRKDGIALTADGRTYFPFIRSIYAAENALAQKRREMDGLENSVVTVGTFTSVSRNLLPPLMKAFKDRYPGSGFVLRQGEYSSIAAWVAGGIVDFGFLNAAFAPKLETKILYREEMLAVLPPGHPLGAFETVPLASLAEGPFILLDEGERSVALTAFSDAGLRPEVAYEVSDDYTILAMARQGLGVSLIYERTLRGFESGLQIRRVREKPSRAVALAWKNLKTLPHAARRFMEFIAERQKDFAPQ